jgi:methylmalonyl-CoA mutase
MAINQQLILKDESYLNKMADIACGSYYIESITDLIANKALDSFKFFEAGGGYFKCLEKNIFSNEIAVQAKRKSDNVYLARQTVIGVNKYRNEKEIIELTPAQRELLDNLPVNNPILSYELDHYLK